MTHAIAAFDSRLTSVRPHPRQLAWQAMEFYAFVHFGMNTMTNREWGDGTESPNLFDPDALDADQWVEALKSAGMTGLILTAKHHDGFCLWPTRTTEHSVAASPWRGGKGDVVAEVAAACERGGLKLGIYLSPWDRNSPAYGSGTAYDDLYVAQLTELLSDYGPVFTLWMDGAYSSALDGRHQDYNWDRIFETTRALQPDTVLSNCGPDTRWCGNEAGVTRSDEWSVVPAMLRDTARIAERSQHDDAPGFGREVVASDLDLGSRRSIEGLEDTLVWYPAEVNTSIRPGWFHHPEEDDQVTDVDTLFDLYERSVGGNTTLLLNLPPDRHGLIAAPDVRVLEQLGTRIRDFKDRRQTTPVSVSSGIVEGPMTSRLEDGVEGTRPWWSPDAGDATPTLELRPTSRTPIEALVVKEAIEVGQAIEEVEVEVIRGDDVVDRRRFGVVGYQRILPLDGVEADAVRVRIATSRGPIVLAGAGIVAAP